MQHGSEDGYLNRQSSVRRDSTRQKRGGAEPCAPASTVGALRGDDGANRSGRTIWTQRARQERILMHTLFLICILLFCPRPDNGTMAFDALPDELVERVLLNLNDPVPMMLTC